MLCYIYVLLFLFQKHSLLLHRTYKCEHRVCGTLEEANKMDLYFAPQGVKQSLYSRVIVRKFEDYRQRLSKAQSRLLHFHPCGEPIQPAPAVPPRRQNVRAKRASVLMKTTQEPHSLLDGNKGRMMELSSPTYSTWGSRLLIDSIMII